jgi:hypothetical protein
MEREWLSSKAVMKECGLEEYDFLNRFKKGFLLAENTKTKTCIIGCDGFYETVEAVSPMDRGKLLDELGVKLESSVSIRERFMAFGTNRVMVGEHGKTWRLGDPDKDFDYKELLYEPRDPDYVRPMLSDLIFHIKDIEAFKREHKKYTPQEGEKPIWTYTAIGRHLKVKAETVERRYMKRGAPIENINGRMRAYKSCLDEWAADHGKTRKTHSK